MPSRTQRGEGVFLSLMETLLLEQCRFDGSWQLCNLEFLTETMLWIACITIFFLYITYCVRWRINLLQTFKRLNIPGPPPNFMCGNLWDIYKHGQLTMQKRWHEQYGPIVGMYFGLHPVMLISDVEILKKILLKDFHNFADRSELVTGENGGTATESLIILKGQRWKEVRSTLTPSFTSKRLKKVTPEVCSSVDKFINNVTKDFEKSTECDIYELYQALTLDTICKTGMGVDFSVQDDIANSKLLKEVKAMFAFPMSFFIIIIVSFPILMQTAGKLIMAILYRTKNSGENASEALLRRCTEVVKLRRSNPELARPDLLQLMLDARKADSASTNLDSLIAGDVSEALQTEEGTGSAGKATAQTENTTARKGKELTDTEVIHNAFIILLAGYETTSSSLAFVTKMLLRFPEVQERVREELMDATAGGTVFEFDRLQKCPYTEAVIQETMRMYAPVHFFTARVAAEEMKYGSLTIPKGMAVFSSVNEVHHDEEVFPNAKEFRPERFLPENKTPAMNFSWQPFGAGPRNCIGMRFAQMEMKLTLAKLLTKYRISSKHEPLNDPFIPTTVLPVFQQIKEPLKCDLEPI